MIAPEDIMRAVLDEIARIDKVLSMLREGWQAAAEAKKEKWMDAINHALDMRFGLMAVRDGKTEVSA